VLKENGLRADENPTTTVVRITGTNQVTRPADGSVLGSDTNAVIPLIVMDDVSLDTALTRLAQMAQMEVILDPGLSGAPPGSGRARVPLAMVSVRWEKLTARQALLALCENFDLVLVKDTATRAVHIRPRGSRGATE